MNEMIRFDITARDSTRDAFQSVDRSLGRLGGAGQTIARQFDLMKGAVAGFAGGLAAGFATGAVSMFTDAVRDSVSSVADLAAQAQQAGIGVEGFQRLNAAAMETRVGTDALVDGLKELQLRTDEFVTTGGGSAAESLRRLGYTADDLKARLANVPAYFLDIISRVQQLDQAARIRVMDEIFGGTGGEQFVRLVDLGADGVRKIGDEAEASGRILDTELVQRAVVLDAQFAVIAETIRVNFVGAVVAAAGEMSKLQQQGASWFRFLQEQRGEVLSPGAMIGDLAAPGPRGDPADDEMRATRARPGDAQPLPISQDNLPPLPYRPPNLLDYDPNGGGGGGGGGGSLRGGGGGGSAAIEADRAQEAIDRVTESLQQQAAMLGLTEREQEIYNEQLAAGVDDASAAGQRIRDLAGAYYDQRDAIEATQQAIDAAHDLAFDFASGLAQDLRSGVKAADALANAFSRLGDRLLDMALDDAITSLLASLTPGAAGGGSAGSGILGLIGSVLGAGLGAPAAGGVFAEGGWTGGAPGDVAGIVHGSEFVVRAGPAARNRAILEDINAGRPLGRRQPESGGRNASGPVTIHQTFDITGAVGKEELATMIRASSVEAVQAAVQITRQGVGSWLAQDQQSGGGEWRG